MSGKHATALDATGKPVGKEIGETQGDRTNIKLGASPAVWYEVSR